MAKLDELGVQLKDFERGLIDFPSLRDGRVVLLCWQLGEGDELEWWHDVDAGVRRTDSALGSNSPLRPYEIPQYPLTTTSTTALFSHCHLKLFLIGCARLRSRSQ